MKRFQMFIHKHYETIKFILMIILLIMAFFIIYNQNQRANQEALNNVNEAIQREKNVARLLEADQAKTDRILETQGKQTQLIICLLIDHGAKIVITPEAEEACRMSIEQAEVEYTPQESSPKPQDPEEPNEQPPDEPPEQFLPQWLIEMLSIVVL